MPRSLASLFLALAALAAPTAADAQLLPRIPLALEVRVGAAIPTGDFADEQPGVEAEAGPAFAAGAAYHLSSLLALYGEYELAAFGCSRCEAAGLDDQLLDQGAGFGLRIALPLAGGRPWLRAGGVYHQLSFSDDDETLTSDLALGYEVGVGLSLPLVSSLWVMPAAGFRTYSAELDLGGLPSETIDVSHLVLDVGFAYRF